MSLSSAHVITVVTHSIQLGDSMWVDMYEPTSEVLVFNVSIVFPLTYDTLERKIWLFMYGKCRMSATGSKKPSKGDLRES